MVTSWRGSGTRQQSCGRTLQRDSQHLLGHRHFQVHAGLQRLAHRVHIAILDVPPVFAQVQGDAVGARLLRQQCGIARDRDSGRGAPGAGWRRDRCSRPGAMPRCKLRLAHERLRRAGRFLTRRFAMAQRQHDLARSSTRGHPGRRSIAARSTRLASRSVRASAQLSACRSARDCP